MGVSPFQALIQVREFLYSRLIVLKGSTHTKKAKEEEDDEDDEDDDDDDDDAGGDDGGDDHDDNDNDNEEETVPIVSIVTAIGCTLQ